MTKSRVFAVAGLLLVVLVGVSVHFSGSDSPSAPPPTTSRSGATTLAGPALTAARAQEITHQVSSADPAQVREALALPDGQALDPALVPALVALTGLTIDPASFHQIGENVAQATAQVANPGQPTSAWVVDLVFVGGTWKIAATQPAGAQK